MKWIKTIKQIGTFQRAPAQYKKVGKACGRCPTVPPWQHGCQD